MRIVTTIRGISTLAMGKTSSILVMVFATLCSSYAADNPVDRAVEFLSNVYSGKTMLAEEWLTKEARNAPMFGAFGGLDALVNQSTEQAKKFGGLRTVTVKDVKREGNTYHVVIEITFMQDHRMPASAAMATQEDIVWNLEIRNQDGVWKLTW